MHIPKEVLAKIDFNLDVLDAAAAIVPAAGIDVETAHIRTDDAFAGMEVS